MKATLRLTSSGEVILAILGTFSYHGWLNRLNENLSRCRQLFRMYQHLVSFKHHHEVYIQDKVRTADPDLSSTF